MECVSRKGESVPIFWTFVYFLVKTFAWMDYQQEKRVKIIHL